MSRPPAGIPDPKGFVASARGKAVLPWQEPHRRDDLRVQLNTRQPERLVLQVEWLSAEMGMEKQAGVEMALREWVARELKRRGLTP